MHPYKTLQMLVIQHILLHRHLTDAVTLARIKMDAHLCLTGIGVHFNGASNVFGIEKAQAIRGAIQAGFKIFVFLVNQYIAHLIRRRGG